MRRTEKHAVLIKAGQNRKCCHCLGTHKTPRPIIIESPIFVDLFIWSFRMTKKGRPAQVKSVKTLIPGLSQAYDTRNGE